MVSREVVRRRRQVLVGALALLAGGAALGVSAATDRPGAEGAPVAAPATPSTGPAGGERTAAAPEGESTSGPDDGRTRAAPTAAPTASDPDRAAGVLSPEVPDAAGGRLVAVPGTRDLGPGAGTGAPDGSEVVQVRVLVEDGLPADADAVAGTVMDVLQDPRGWGPDGWAFARTDGAPGSPPADVDVVLASPDLTEELCAPLDTGGVLSCRDGDRVVLTWYRWAGGAEGYGEDREGYRRYLVSHEVGHFLGHGHEPCPGAGERAPVMLQQTKGLQGCAPNPWPHP